MWARGYFVASSGHVTDETIMNYIEQQGKEPPDGDFRVEGEL
jgi:putative transposase